MRKKMNENIFYLIKNQKGQSKKIFPANSEIDLAPGPDPFSF